ncbi:MAG: TVP38/TMEM64 family protein [Lentisphaeria bacterium]|nr:TVP38/TMEM64 family protein [Lentisphaeria bacterium]
MKKLVKPILFCLCAIIGFLLYWKYQDQFTLEALQNSRINFEQTLADHRFLFIIGFMLIYITFVALSLPMASVLTLLAGALFDLVQGTIIVSISSTVGATSAMLIARYFFRDWVAEKFDDKLQAFHKGLEKNGKWYLLSLRLAPVFPFFMINLVMGLTKMKTSTYAWVSMLGMFPGTIVYVNAGKQLGSIESTKDLVSPALIGSFIALAILPYIIKFIMKFIAPEKKEVEHEV